MKWKALKAGISAMLAVILLTTLLIPVPAQASSEPPNLLTNPGFETPIEEGELPGWHFYYGADGIAKPGIKVETTDSLSHGGSYSLNVSDSATNAAIVVYSDPIEIAGGDTFNLNLKVNNSSGTMITAVRFYKRATDSVISGYLKQVNTSFKAVKVWTDVSLEAAAPTDAAYARVLVYTVSASTGAAYVDDLSLSVKPDNGGGTIMFQETNLGPQIHTINTHRAAFGRDSSGNLIAYSTLIGAPANLLVIDVKTERLIAQIPVEDTVNGTRYSSTYVRGLAVQPDGTVYLAGTPSYMFKYVPGASKVQFMQKAAGSQTFDMKNGPEGVLIGGTYNKGEAFEFNTVTNQVYNLGQILPGEAYAYSVAFDEAHNDYYFGIGAHAHLIRYDRETGTKSEIPLPAAYASSEFIYDMTVSGGKLFMRFSPGDTIAMDLNTLQFEAVSQSVQSRLVSQPSPVDGKIYYTSGSKLGYYDPATKQYTTLDLLTDGDAYGFTFAQLNEPAFPGYSLIGVTRQGRVFKYNPGTGTLKVIVLPINGEPTELQTVKHSEDGKIHTSGYLSGGNAIYDPQTGQKQEFTGETLGLAQKLPGTQTDRIYSYKDKLYYVTYPNMRVYEFDPHKPWDMKDPVQPNPKFLFTAYDIGEQDRGLAGTIIGDKGKLAIGTVPKYGRNGGTLAIYDLQTSEREVYLNVVDQQSVTAVTYKDGFIYGGSAIWGGLGQAPAATEAKLFIWDMEKKQKVFEMVPVPGATAITELINGPDGNIWGSAEGYLFIFNPMTRQVVYAKQLFARTYSSAVWRDTQFEVGTDGNVYGVQNNKFFRIDALTKQMTVIRDVGKRNWMTQDEYGQFYLTEGTELLKITIPELVLKPVGAQMSVSPATLNRHQSPSVAIQGLLEKGRVISGLEKRSPVYFSSDPSVIGIESGKLVAGNPGTASVWAEVRMNGITVQSNRVSVTVAVTLASLRSSVNAYIQSGAMGHALSQQLTNALDQAQHFMDKGDPGKAGKHIGDLINHLEKSTEITAAAKSQLLIDAAALEASLTEPQPQS